MKKAKRVISAVLSLSISGSAIQTVPFIADAEMQKYPYTMFASSNSDGAITINANNIGINGKIATNGTVVAGERFDKERFSDEQICSEMIYIPNKIDSDFFGTGTVQEIDGNYDIAEVNININTPVSVNGTTGLTGNVNIQSGIRSVDDITIRGDIQNSGNTVIYSKYGNIDIECTNVNLCGLVYAPFGNVHIKAGNLNLNNTMIIADTITIDTPNVNTNYSEYFGRYFSETSDNMMIPEEDYQYFNDDNANGIPDFFENSINWKYITDTDGDGVPDIIEINNGTDPYTIEEDYHNILDSYTLELMYKNPLILYKPEEQKLYVYGDLNDDLVLDAFDLTLLKRYAMNGTYDKLGDLDDDGDIDIDDVNWLLDFLLVKAKSFPVYEQFDTDKDGLSDYVEAEYSFTSIRNEDTDNDGLSDYFEFVVMGSDPNTADNTANDDDDQDGLTNKAEAEHNTDPFTADTDGDGISDGDEVNVYHTDPLNEDTDGDGLTDGEEINDLASYGFDPKNARTNGTPDGNRIFEQVIPADDAILKEINSPDNAYNLSLILNASGNARSCLRVMKSGYTEYMKDGSAIGAVPEIIYDDSFTLQDITLKFEIKEEFRESVIDLFSENYSSSYISELDGIKRLNVFKFFEEIDEAMPINTEYDVTNNTVYVTLTSDTFETDNDVDGINVGSYSLVDLEVWGAIMNASDEEETPSPSPSPRPSVMMYPGNINILANNVGPIKRTRTDGSIKKILENYISAKVSSKETAISGAVFFGGHFYSVVYGENISWSAAETRCENLGGHLMTPSSASEFALLTNGLTHGATTNHYWIGAHYVSGSWKWVNNEGNVTYIDTVTKEYDNELYNLENYRTDLHMTQLYYADGMSYYSDPSNVSSASGYIIEWDSLSAYVKGAKGLSAIADKTLLKSRYGLLMLNGPLSKTSNIDTDGDGIPDFLELNSKLLTKLYGVNTTKTSASMSQIISLLAKNNTSKSIVNSSQLGVKLAYAANRTSNGNGNATAYALSVPMEQFKESPVSPDFDHDYYIGNDDKHPKKFDRTLIVDKCISDTDSIKGINPSRSSYNSNNGALIEMAYSEGSARKNAFDFDRSNSAEYRVDGYSSRFSLIPEQFSDYEFRVLYVDSLADVEFKVTYIEKHIFSADEIIEVKPVSAPCLTNDGAYYYYALVPGIDYTISVNHKCNTPGYEVIVSQNNWFYAPDGAFAQFSANSSNSYGLYNDHNLFYLRDTTVKTVIENYCTQKLGFTSATVGDFENLTEAQKRESCADFADKFIKLYVDSSEQVSLDFLGNVVSYTGDVVSSAGAIFTAAGATTLSNFAAAAGVCVVVWDIVVKIEDHNQKKYRESIADSFYNGKYNIVMDVVGKKKNKMDAPGYTPVVETYYSIDWYAWENAGYVYKYTVDGTGKNSRNRAKSITKLNYYIPQKTSSGWVLNLYNG